MNNTKLNNGAIRYFFILKQVFKGGNYMNLTTLVLLSLAVFRLTRLFVYDRITIPLREKFMNEEYDWEDGKKEYYYVPKNFIGFILSCHWCFGCITTAILSSVYLFIPYGEFVIYFLAIAGLGAILQWVVSRE